MTTHRATIPGEPVPKARPRLGKGRAYTPTATKAWEKRAAWAIKQSISARGIDSPVTLDVDVYCSRPKGHSAKRRETREPKPTKPDADNYAKAVCDALEKSGVIVNDSRVWSLTARKWWVADGEDPRVEIALVS